MVFESDFFQKREFTKEQINKYFINTERDLKIAESAHESEVIFTFAYQAFLKLGITLIAFNGHKVKSRQGHHVKIIEKMSEILKDKKVLLHGEAMRRKRNMDLYAEGTVVPKKEAMEYLNFIRKIHGKIKKII